MSREILFSAILHGVILVLALATAPFSIKSQRQYDEVIRVSLTALPEIQQPEPLEPVAIPEAVAEELAEIPIDPPTVKDKVKLKPKEKPKPRKKKNSKKKQPTQSKAGKDDKQNEIQSPMTAEGAPFAGARVDNASFNYPYWFTQTFNKIQRNYRNPVAYDGTLICAIYFQVIQSGRVVEVRVDQSSGIEAFDEACELAVQRSAPFPPLPKDFRDEILGITLPFKYDPR
ncbi:MAG: energy transducer TonB [Candidatus Zixiibacteriota bacterium]